MARFFPTLAPSDPVVFGPGLGVHPLRAPEAQGEYLPLPGLGSAVEALLLRARATPERPAYFAIDVDDRVFALTCAELLAGARRAAAALAARGLRRRDPVVLCLDTGPDLLALLYGCGLLGAIPALIEPPLGLARQSEWPERVGRMMEKSGA